MFSAIRAALVAKYGNTGRQRLFITDFEIVTINAISDVFPEATVNGCTFHFRQALIRHVADLGLRHAYSTDPEIQKWIRQIMGLTLLPAVFIPIAWQTLKHPPTHCGADLHGKMAEFSAYVERTWMFGTFPPTLWCHYGNTGPRTTNLAEGWHNSLNHSFGMPHPSPANFLHWLQKCQHQVQCREIQLESGRPTKAKSATYRELDNRISDAKLRFGLRSRFLFVNMFPQQGMWNALTSEILSYLNHVGFLSAGSSFTVNS